MAPLFAGYFRSDPRAFAGLSPFASPLLLTVLMSVIAASKGDTPLGRFVFWFAVAMLGLFVLFAGALVALNVSGLAKGLLLAEASVAVAVADVIVPVAATMRSVWSRHPSR
jgi:hypothetical protein